MTKPGLSSGKPKNTVHGNPEGYDALKRRTESALHILNPDVDWKYI